MSNHPLIESSGLRWIIGIAGIFIIISALKAAEAIVIPMMLALFISIISLPPLRWLIGRGVPSAIAILFILGVVVGLGSILTLIVLSSVDTLMLRLPEYQERLANSLLNILPQIEPLGLTFERETIVEQLNPAQALDLVGRAISGLGNVLTSTFLVIFIVLFILLEQASLPTKLRQALPNSERSFVNTNGFIRQVNRYLVIKTSVSLVTGVLIGGWLWWLGVDFAVLWGLLAFLLNFIPNIGSLLAAIPAVLLALLQLGLADATLVALGYIAANIILGTIIEPRLMGRGLGLSPLVVFLSLITWGWLFGPVGMLLSIPLTMILKIALEENPSTHWIGIMLSNIRADDTAEEQPSKPESP
jgi:predicted PurR-regulated permease PerM